MAEKKKEHTGKKNQVKKRMNKIPFGKKSSKGNVLGNYTFFSVRFFRVPYSKLKKMYHAILLAFYVTCLRIRHELFFLFRARSIELLPF